jgi:hypothetical protein
MLLHNYTWSTFNTEINHFRSLKFNVKWGKTLNKGTLNAVYSQNCQWHLKLAQYVTRLIFLDIVREHRPYNTLTFQREEGECLAAPDAGAAVGQHGTR